MLDAPYALKLTNTAGWLVCPSKPEFAPSISLPDAITSLDRSTGEPFLCLYNSDSLIVFVPIASD